MLIYDILLYNQPAVLQALSLRYPIRRPAALVSLYINGIPLVQWRQIMQERPMPGKGGLLEGEIEEVL